MISFRGLLINPAKEAGIKIPDNPDEYAIPDYPHWHVYCALQLGRRIPTMTEHWSNAKIISAIPDEIIKTITVGAVKALGIQ